MGEVAEGFPTGLVLPVMCNIEVNKVKDSIYYRIDPIPPTTVQAPIANVEADQVSVIHKMVEEDVSRLINSISRCHLMDHDLILASQRTNHAIIQSLSATHRINLLHI